MSDPARHRVRLWLRSEAALGLTSVPVPVDLSDAVVQEMPDHAPHTHVAPYQHEEPAYQDQLTSRGPSRPAAGVDLPALAAPVVALFAEDSVPGPITDATPFTSAELSPDQKRERLKVLDVGEVSGCVKCRLHETRTKTVFGEGDPNARLFFIGEGPGENEDLQGRPFVGRAGELLNKMIGAMGLKREQVFIANIVKCRPPGNREPASDEVTTCTPYLISQLETVRPKVIVTLGRPSSQYMLQSKLAMSRLRGQWQSWRGIKLMPTYHPAYVLRNYTDQTRAAVWDDLKKVMVELNLPVPPAAR